MPNVEGELEDLQRIGVGLRGGCPWSSPLAVKGIPGEGDVRVTGGQAVGDMQKPILLLE